MRQRAVELGAILPNAPSAPPHSVPAPQVGVSADVLFQHLLHRNPIRRFHIYGLFFSPVVVPPGG